MQAPFICNAFHKTIFAILAASISVTGSVHAQTGVLTQDLKSELEEHAQTLKQIDEYVKQGMQYETQLQQYQQMMTKVENLGSNFQLLPNSLGEIDASPLIQANCNAGSSSMVGGLLNNVTSLLAQPLAKNQQAICAEIVTTQVDKYNSTVEMLKTLSTNTSALQTLSSLTSTFTTAGESSAAATQAAGLGTEMAARMDAWGAHMKADEAILSSLQDMQSTLARQAMNAKPSMEGDAVQAAVLTAAFSYHPSL
jgi:hypothetical protein